jgi:hypothetical protein
MNYEPCGEALTLEMLYDMRVRVTQDIDLKTRWELTMDFIRTLNNLQIIKTWSAVSVYNYVK